MSMLEVKIGGENLRGGIIFCIWRCVIDYLKIIPQGTDCSKTSRIVINLWCRAVVHLWEAEYSRPPIPLCLYVHMYVCMCVCMYVWISLFLYYIQISVPYLSSPPPPLISILLNCNSLIREGKAPYAESTKLINLRQEQGPSFYI